MKGPLIGLVIVAHGRLARALLDATEHVVGPQAGARAIAVEPTDDLPAAQVEIAAAVREVDEGAGVVVVTDMFGGTPSNLAHGALCGAGVEVVYGANLPLLVKLAKMRDRPLAEAVLAALEAGRKYIDSAASILEPAKPR
ncbi:MAG TPA: PTS fructose transporter subunit IIA [Paracoccaceae bacterium]|nr:PTS fructose transporter subunit IIA [Paracoccaceae bacterium]